MHKAIVTCVSIITAGIAAIACFLISSNERITLKTETRDRFTVCIETVMSKSIEAQKPISAGEAKDICLQAERF